MITITPVGLHSLQGRRVILERSAPEHAPFLRQCYEDHEFMDLYRLAQDRHHTEEQIREYLRKEQKLLPQQLKKIEWVIHILKENGEKKPIGLASLADYRQAHRRAEFLIGISLPEYRGSKFPLESALLVLDFGFNQIQLHKMVTYVYVYNDFGQKNIISFGFIQEGFLRKHIFSAQQGFIDVYFNGMLESDFRTNARLSRFSKLLLGYDITLKPIPPQPLPQENLDKAKKLFMQQLIEK
jgi:RimJ/RimL family protein N-acetyltransferase